MRLHSPYRPPQAGLTVTAAEDMQVWMEPDYE